MNEPTPTCKELCKRATKGPRIHIKWESIIWTRLNDGCRGSNIARIPDENAPRCIADAQLIARLSPEVVMQVYEALESIKCRVDDSTDPTSGRIPPLIAINRAKMKACVAALRLLDGQSPTNSPTP